MLLHVNPTSTDIEEFTQILDFGHDESPGHATWRMRASERQRGKIGYVLLWLIGVPLPILLLVYLLRGCT